MGRYVIKQDAKYWSRTSKEWVSYKDDCAIYESREECYRDLGQMSDLDRNREDGYYSNARIVKDDEVVWCRNDGVIEPYGTVKEFWEEVNEGGIEIIFCPQRDRNA